MSYVHADEFARFKGQYGILAILDVNGDQPIIREHVTGGRTDAAIRWHVSFHEYVGPNPEESIWFRQEEVEVEQPIDGGSNFTSARAALYVAQTLYNRYRRLGWHRRADALEGLIDLLDEETFNERHANRAPGGVNEWHEQRYAEFL